jgi:hypothetical protein
MTEPEVSQRTLEETPEKAFAFLRGVGTCPGAYAQLRTVGFGQSDLDEAWGLTHVASNYDVDAAPLPATDPLVRNALIELDKTDEPLCQRVDATLRRHHPEQAAFVFDNLEPAKGPAALFVVSKLLARLGKLEEGRSDETREADKAAIATLTKRGITPQERARLAELVRVGQSANAPEIITPSPESVARQQEALKALHAWYSEWSATARAVITRRDYLIRLGLSKRRPSKQKESESTEETLATEW